MIDITYTVQISNETYSKLIDTNEIDKLVNDYSSMFKNKLKKDIYKITGVFNPDDMVEL